MQIKAFTIPLPTPISAGAYTPALHILEPPETVALSRIWDMMRGNGWMCSVPDAEEW